MRDLTFRHIVDLFIKFHLVNFNSSSSCSNGTLQTNKQLILLEPHVNPWRGCDSIHLSSMTKNHRIPRNGRGDCATVRAYNSPFSQINNVVTKFHVISPTDASGKWVAVHNAALVDIRSVHRVMIKVRDSCFFNSAVDIRSVHRHD